MKTRMLIAAAALVLTIGSTSAQNPPAAAENPEYQKVNLVRAEKNFAVCLQSENEGATESALGLVARMKLALPERRFESLEKECVRLITEGATERIRYRAYLVLNLLGQPRIFAAEAQTAYDDNDEMFAAVADRLQATYLSENGAR